MWIEAEIAKAGSYYEHLPARSVAAGDRAYPNRKTRQDHGGVAAAFGIAIRSLTIEGQDPQRNKTTKSCR
jgi:hypothetical protein